MARAISPLTATLNIRVCVHPCATTTSTSARVFVCLCVCFSSSSLHSFLVKAIGDQWRLKVTNHPSSPTLPSNPPPPSPSSSLTTCPHAHAQAGASWGPRSHSYWGPQFLLRVCRGSEAAEGNYSSALIGIIILVG